MLIEPLRLDGTYTITGSPFFDDRGYFMRFWDRDWCRERGLTTSWVQENQAFSKSRGIIRGLHFQKPPHAETKLVRVVRGTILDVFVDLRKQSVTYGQWDAVELSAENHKMVYIPKGFAHGYCTLTDETLVHYKVDEYYAPQAEGGLRWSDPTIGIRWPIGNPQLSNRDRQLPTFDNFITPF